MSRYSFVICNIVLTIFVVVHSANFSIPNCVPSVAMCRSLGMLWPFEVSKYICIRILCKHKRLSNFVVSGEYRLYVPVPYWASLSLRNGLSHVGSYFLLGILTAI